MTVQMHDLNTSDRISVPVGSVPVARRAGIYRNVVKRGFDIAFVILTSVVVLPVVLILAAIVARDGHSPFYTNERVGRGGRNFGMLKLRSMVPNAHQQLERHLAACPKARHEWETTQKLKDDPRITRFGRFIRKTSLDELPQLWNVLVGDMSMVGPRPMMPEQRALYPGLAYYALRPGITGPWQVSDRNTSTFAQRADFDRAYEQDLSLSYDMSLILRTVAVVVRGTGY